MKITELREELKKRKLETAGGRLALLQVKPLFMLFVCLCVGVLVEGEDAAFHCACSVVANRAAAEQYTVVTR